MKFYPILHQIEPFASLPSRGAWIEIDRPTELACDIYCRSLHGDEVFKYLKIYRDSLSDETEIKDVEELLKYYINNREGLIAYQSQGLNLPEHPDGLEYRNMGTMENHIWSVIAKRMKHSHTCWSKRENHLAKILAKKCGGKLYEVTEKSKHAIFKEETVEEILMAEEVAKKVGKGYEYPTIGHMVGLEGKIIGERKKLFAMSGF